MEKEKNYVSAVIYLYNNETEVKGFLQFVTNKLKELFEHFEVICINDASTDRTVEGIKHFAEKKKDFTINVLNMSYFQGLEICMNAGVEFSTGDFIFEFDNLNVNYQADMIEQVYRRVLEGYDIVNASSHERRAVTSKLFYFLINRYSGSQHALDTESFRVLSRRALNRVQSMHITVPYRKFVYANSGLKMDTLYYDVIKNADTNKHISRRDMELKKDAKRQLAVDTLILFTDIGYRFTSWMSFTMMAITMLTAIYACIIFFQQTPIEGWTTTILFLSFAFFGVFAILTIIIKYLSIIINLIFKKQKYVFESIEKV